MSETQSNLVDGLITKARRTRRSGADVTPDEFLDPETNKPITRRSRKNGAANDFDVPTRYRKPKWDYQWFTISYLGEKVDAADFVDIADGGWRAVRPDEMPGFMPKEYEGKTIDRRGQRLFTRPMHLSIESREEDRERARTQKREKLAQAQMGDPDGAGRHQAARTHRVVSAEWEPLPGGAEVEEV